MKYHNSIFVNESRYSTRSFVEKQKKNNYDNSENNAGN